MMQDAVLPIVTTRVLVLEKTTSIPTSAASTAIVVVGLLAYQHYTDRHFYHNCFDHRRSLHHMTHQSNSTDKHCIHADDTLSTLQKLCRRTFLSVVDTRVPTHVHRVVIGFIGFSRSVCDAIIRVLSATRLFALGWVEVEAYGQDQIVWTTLNMGTTPSLVSETSSKHHQTYTIDYGASSVHGSHVYLRGCPSSFHGVAHPLYIPPTLHQRPNSNIGILPGYLEGDYRVGMRGFAGTTEILHLADLIISTNTKNVFQSYPLTSLRFPLFTLCRLRGLGTPERIRVIVGVLRRTRGVRRRWTITYQRKHSGNGTG
ncbi:hypothetical protein GG344DRAFT_75830 [Lentinula edodes]|nr:hypothetical protein GG344DRAFT_75830 [Lentinula edodes]